MTNRLDKVCMELGWDKQHVEECGGVFEFMQQQEQIGDLYTFF